MPFVNEHSARLKSPEMQHIREKITEGGRLFNKDIPKSISVVWYTIETTDGERTIAQSLRFPIKKWNIPESKKWLVDNNIDCIKFEEAKPEDKGYKFVQNVNSEEADIYIYGDIGNKIDGDLVAQEIRMLSNSGVKVINERINSGGGSIDNGFSIIGANQNVDAKIKTYNDGIAASMGAMILISGDEVNVADYSLTMIHNPSVFGISLEEMPEGKDKQILTLYRDSLSTILQKRTGKGKEEIDKLLLDETWLNAKQTKRMGLADNVFIPKKQLENINEPDEIFELVMNEYKPKIKIKMKEVINFLNLGEDVEEAKILDKIKNLDDQAKKSENLKSDLDSLQAKYDENNKNVESLNSELTKKNEALEKLQSSIDNKDEEIVNMILDNAVMVGKVKDSDKDELREKCKNNIEILKLILEKTSPSPVSLLDAIIDDPKHTGNERDDWGHKEYAKKDPKTLNKIRIEDPDKYKELIEKSYGKE